MKITKSHRLDKIRLIFFSTGETDFRQFDFHLQKVLLYLLGIGIVFTGIFFGTVTIINTMYQTNTSKSVLEANDFLKRKILALQQDIHLMNNKLHGLEEDTQGLETLVGLSVSSKPKDSNSQNLFSEDDMLMASLPVDYEYQTDKMSQYLTNLEGRVDRAIQVQDEIEHQFLQTRKEIKHIPSIRPIQGARITDKFGNRKDPFVERIRHHNGIDLAAKFGTKVYASASGVVEFVRTKYRLNKGYGRVIIINHGYGYKTLYGHLSKIFVRPGRKVNRWDVIGLSGDSGRSTGPHLHYEVWHNRRPLDPEEYLLN